MPENRACKDAILKICGRSFYQLRLIRKLGNSIVRGARYQAIGAILDSRTNGLGSVKSTMYYFIDIMLYICNIMKCV
jgi:hypothetical protein